ncbi:MAG TPA: M23 family metallopeptidase [Acidimicrobiia bacterium]|nr:M23 family metallopeptidase [Acidimicrobiia bacterium]
MRKRFISLAVACAAFVSVVVVTPAEAACRPTTLGDLFPPTPAVPAPPALVTSPMIPAGSGEAATAGTTDTTEAVTETATTASTAPAETTSTTTSIVASATASSPPAPAVIPAARCSYVYRMQWPVLGGGAILSVFGADRDGGSRRHAGVDIVAPKLTPIVAVADGTVSGVHSARSDCCWVTIKHDNGWSSAYLHLNNDLGSEDSGGGVGIRPDLFTGLRVVAGEVIGWLGDSGNAEPGIPHLHFELHLPGGTPIDPLASLRWAYRRMPAPALAAAPSQFRGPFIDDDGLLAEQIFDLLVTLGSITACDQWGAAVCPHQTATNSDAATWVGAITRVLVPTAMPAVAPEMLEEIAFASRACPPEGCPSPPVTVGELAAMLVWAADQRAHDEAVTALEEGEPEDGVPSQPSPYWTADPVSAWARLVAEGRADDCTMIARPLSAPLTRAGLAEMIGKALGYLPVVDCGALA